MLHQKEVLEDVKLIKKILALHPDFSEYKVIINFVETGPSIIIRKCILEDDVELFLLIQSSGLLKLYSNRGLEIIFNNRDESLWHLSSSYIKRGANLVYKFLILKCIQKGSVSVLKYLTTKYKLPPNPIIYVGAKSTIFMVEYLLEISGMDFDQNLYQQLYNKVVNASSLRKEYVEDLVFKAHAMGLILDPLKEYRKLLIKNQEADHIIRY